MRVAVYAIAKNEEHNIDGWAESAADASQIVLVDTGSTDHTVAKAVSLLTKHKLTLSQATVDPWRFDDARNAALAIVDRSMDFCIALDLDERLQPGWWDALKVAYDNKVTRPRYTYTWSWADDTFETPGLQYGGDKIHARHGYRWKHPVHEILTPKDALWEVTGWVDLEIHHFPDPNKSRTEYLPLLERAVLEDRIDDRLAHYYARELMYHGRTDQAAEEFKRHLSLARAVWEPERAASMRYLAVCEPAEAERWLLRACAEAPGYREPWLDLARLYLQNNMIAECVGVARRGLQITERPMVYLTEPAAWGGEMETLASLGGVEALAQ